MKLYSKFIAAFLYIALACPAALAQTGTPQTSASLNAEINRVFPDQLAGVVIPFNTRQMLLDMVASGLSGPASGTTCTPGSLSTYQPFVNTTGAPSAATLNFFDGSQCVQWATLNQSAHIVSGVFGGTLSTGANGGTGGQITFNGATTGNAVVVALAAAGTPTLTLPNTTGTFAVGATAPLALNVTTGAMSITGAAGQVLAGTPAAFTATPTLGVNGGTGGQVTFNGATSGAGTINVTATAGTLQLNNAAATVDTSGNIATTANLTGANLVSTTTFFTQAQATLTGTSGTVNSTSQIISSSGSFTLTLPSAAVAGRWLYILNTAANTVVSASSNVIPRTGGAAGTAIIGATAGGWASLQSNGTNWQLMAGTP